MNQQEQTVLNLGIPGILFLKNVTLTQIAIYYHIIDGSDVDNVGIAGIEKVFDGALRESTNPSSRWITKKYK